MSSTVTVAPHGIPVVRKPKRFNKLDKDEDKWNSIAKSAYHGKQVNVADAPKVVETDSIRHESVNLNEKV